MNGQHLDQLRQLLLSIPHTTDPREVCPGPLSNVGFAAGRYAMAQEVLQLLEEIDSEQTSSQAIIDLRERTEVLGLSR